MSKPARNADPHSIRAIKRTFFTTAKSLEGRNLLQSEAKALLFIDVLRSYAAQSKFVVHDFVVMPNHVHVLLTLDQLTSIEKAMGLIKGHFSYRVKKELGCALDIWQPGFSEVRILSRASFLKHRDYVYQNPVKAGLVDSPEKFPYSSAYFKHKKRAAAKAGKVK